MPNIEIHAEATFHVDTDKIGDLIDKAREVDDLNGVDIVEETYTFAQAFQVVWHDDPEWLVSNGVLKGWTLDKADGEPIWNI